MNKSFKFIPVLFFLIICSVFVSAADLTSGLINAYDFKNNQNSSDISGNGHHLIERGGSYTTNGFRINGMLERLDVPNVIVNDSNTFSIVTKMNIENFEDGYLYFYKENNAISPPFDGFQFVQWGNSAATGIAVRFRNSSNWENVNFYGNPIFNFNVNYTLGMSFNNSIIKIYINGIKIKEGSVNFNKIDTKSNRIIIGSDTYSKFNITFSNWGAYNRVLTDTEFLAFHNNVLFNNTVPTTPTGSTISKTPTVVTATGAGSTDADSDAITYYYEFRCASAGGTILQAYSTDNTWTRTAACAGTSTVYANIKAYDGYNYSTSAETESVVLNILPTTPTGSSISKTTTVVTATGAGSTDADGDSITYYYEFRCTSAGGTLLQAYSTDNTWTRTAACAGTSTVYANIKAYDGYNYSTSAETESVVLNIIPTTPTGSSISSFTGFGNIITATGAGSTDADGDPITYYYTFRCNSTGGTIIQSESTTNTYTVTNACGNDATLYVGIRAYDGISYSSSAEYESTDLPTVSVSYPIIDQTNLKYSFNVTHDLDTYLTTCSATTNSTNVTCAPNAGLNNITCTVNSATETYGDVKISPYCTYNTQSINLTEEVVFFDNINPIITVNSNSPSILNTSSYYNVTSNPVIFNYTFSDTNLYGYNLTCYNTTDEIEFTNQSLGISSPYNLLNYKVFTNPGVKTCKLLVADSHTVNVFESDVQKVKENIFSSKIESIKVDDIEIKFDNYKSDLQLKTMDYEIKTDRVSPIFELEDKVIVEDIKTLEVHVEDIKTLEVHVESETEYVNIYYDIVYTGNAYKVLDHGYEGHAVILPNNNLKNGYWIDAEDEFNNSIVNYEIDKSNNKISYHVMVDKNKLNSENKIYKTDSIGGLNIVELDYDITILPGREINITAIYNTNPIPVNVNITRLSNTYQYNLTTPGIIPFMCGISTIKIYNNSFTDIIYEYLSNDCNYENYSVNFYDIILDVNVYSKYNEQKIYGANITVNSSSESFTLFDNPGKFYLAKDELYSINVKTNNTFYTETFQKSENGEYKVDVYLDTNLTMNLKDEFTKNNFNISSPDDIILYTYCLDGSSYSVNINSVSFNYVSACDVDKLRFSVNYLTDSYYRTILMDQINISNENLTIWLVDLETSTLFFNTFQNYSLTDQLSNAKLYLTKNIEGTTYVITSDYFNVETKVGTYLLYGEQYTIIVESDEDGQKNLGFYTADSTGDKLIKYFSLQLQPSDVILYDNTLFYITYDNSTGSDRYLITYNASNVTTANLYIYNDSVDNGLIYYNELTSDNGTFIYTPLETELNLSKPFRINITNSDSKVTTFNGNLIGKQVGTFVLDIILMGYVTPMFLALFLVVILSCIALIFTFNTASIGGIFFVGIAWVFSWLGFLNNKEINVWIGTAALSLAIIIAIGNLIKNRYR
jgi:hypothetical protein